MNAYLHTYFFFFLDQTLLLANASSVSQTFHCVHSGFDLEFVVKDAVYT